jgi:hypothetical protein
MKLRALILLMFSACASVHPDEPKAGASATDNWRLCRETKSGVKNTLCQTDVLVTVQKQVPALQSCLAGNTSAQVLEKVLVSYTIQPDGRIDEIGFDVPKSVATNTKSEDIETDAVLDCAARALADFKFERSRYGVPEVRFSVPIVAQAMNLTLEELTTDASTTDVGMTFEETALEVESETEDDLEMGVPQIKAK